MIEWWIYRLLRTEVTDRRKERRMESDMRLPLIMKLVVVVVVVVCDERMHGVSFITR